MDAELCTVRFSALTTQYETTLLAHASGLSPGDAWWLAWYVDPLVVVSLCAVTLVYLLGLFKLWRQVGIGRVLSKRRALAFLLGIQTVAIALMSPLDTLSNDLSWVHMIQHTLLTVVAAPLIMFGSPGMLVVWAIPLGSRRDWAPVLAGKRPSFFAAVGNLLWNPGFVWLLYAAGLWLWHIPWLYENALRSQFVHDLEHLTFFLTACLFWRLVVDIRTNRALESGVAVVYLFSTSMHSMFLGVFMALSPVAWYGIYSGRTDRWGYSPLEDQQLAGAIMWMPACTSFAIAAVVIFVQFMNRVSDPSIARR